jgi:hypothetical protein
MGCKPLNSTKTNKKAIVEKSKAKHLSFLCYNFDYKSIHLFYIRFPFFTWLIKMAMPNPVYTASPIYASPAVPQMATASPYYNGPSLYNPILAQQQASGNNRQSMYLYCFIFL